MLTELQRTGVGVFHFGGRIALGGDQRSAQRDLQCEFVLNAPEGIGQSLEQLQRLGEMVNRLCVR